MPGYPLKRKPDGKIIKNSAARLVWCPQCQPPPTGEIYLPVKIQPAPLGYVNSRKDLRAAPPCLPNSLYRTQIGWTGYPPRPQDDFCQVMVPVFHDPRWSSYAYIQSGGDKSTLAAIKRVGADLEIRATWLLSIIGNGSVMFPGEACYSFDYTQECSQHNVAVPCDQCYNTHWPYPPMLTMEQYVDGINTNWTGELFRSAYIRRCIGKVELVGYVTGCDLKDWEIAEIGGAQGWSALRCRCRNFPTAFTLTVSGGSIAFSGVNCGPDDRFSQNGSCFLGCSTLRSQTYQCDLHTGTFALGTWWSNPDDMRLAYTVPNLPGSTFDDNGLIWRESDFTNFAEYQFSFVPYIYPSRCTTYLNTGTVQRIAIVTPAVSETTLPYLFETSYKRRRVAAIYRPYDFCCRSWADQQTPGLVLNTMYLRFTGTPTIANLLIRYGRTTAIAYPTLDFLAFGAIYSTLIEKYAPPFVYVKDDWWSLRLDTPVPWTYTGDMLQNIVLDFAFDNIDEDPISPGGTSYWWDSHRPATCLYAYSNGGLEPKFWRTSPTPTATQMLPEVGFGYLP